MDGTLSSFIPSVIIALSTIAMFACGRLIAWVTPASHVIEAAVRAVVMFVTLAAFIYFYFSPSSRYALLLPIGFAAGYFSFGRKNVPPGIFERRR